VGAVQMRLYLINGLKIFISPPPIKIKGLQKMQALFFSRFRYPARIIFPLSKKFFMAVSL
jgi:hypothetical protein